MDNLVLALLGVCRSLGGFLSWDISWAAAVKLACAVFQSTSCGTPGGFETYRITPSIWGDPLRKVELTLSLPSELRSFGGVSGG